MTTGSVEPFIGRRVAPVGETPTGGHDVSRLSADEPGAGGFLLGEIVGDGLGLLGPERIDGRESVDRGVAEQNRRTLPFDIAEVGAVLRVAERTEEHTSTLPSLNRTSYAAFCLKKKNTL